MHVWVCQEEVWRKVLTMTTLNGVFGGFISTQLYSKTSDKCIFLLLNCHVVTVQTMIALICKITAHISNEWRIITSSNYVAIQNIPSLCGNRKQRFVEASWKLFAALATSRSDPYGTNKTLGTPFFPLKSAPQSYTWPLQSSNVIFSSWRLVKMRAHKLSSMWMIRGLCVWSILIRLAPLAWHSGIPSKTIKLILWFLISVVLCMIYPLGDSLCLFW